MDLLEIQINNSYLSNEQYHYEIEVSKQGTTWTVTKSYHEFRLFFDELYKQFQNYQLPYLPEDWNSADSNKEAV